MGTSTPQQAGSTTRTGAALLPGRARGLAVFDLDRTLVPGSSLGVMARLLVDQGQLRRRHLARELVAEAVFARRGLRDEALERLVRRLLARATGREWSPLATAAVVAGAAVAARTYPAGRWLIEHHRAAGDFVVLLSASPQELVASVGRAVGADVAVGTRLDVVDGRLSGRLAGPLCHGPGKLARLRDVVGLVDFSRVTAYADSASDLPLLEACRRPVVVNPDRAMAARAKAAGWPVVRLA